MYSGIDDLDATATLAAAESNVRARRSIEVEGLLLVARWADLHAADPKKAPGGGSSWAGYDQLTDIGGEGTPMVRELCLPELGIARGVHTLSARAVLADVLDLRHRLPLTWRVVTALDAEVWVARKVAFLTRHLSHPAAGVVDAAVAEAIGGQAPARVLDLAAAKIIEVDRAAHTARVEAQRRRRYVGLSRIDEFGLRQVIARVDAGDALWADAMLDRIADILVTRPDLRPETPAEITRAEITRDELRSVAFGWLARPADLLTLLLETAQPSSEHEEAPEASPAVVLSARTLDLLASTDLTKLRPKVDLYVHLHQGAVEGTTGGVARVEGLGPMLLTQVTRLLAHAHVVVKPVIDLNTGASVSSYEHPETTRERVHLRTNGEVFPHATTISRKLDLDHPAPWDPGGSPGQTGDHNAAPLGRTNHRAKTHLGYRLKQTGPDEYLWRTPHGLHRHVDHTGTHPIDNIQANELADPGWLDRALDRLEEELARTQ